MHQKAFEAYRDKIVRIAGGAQSPEKEGVRKQIVIGEGVEFALIDDTAEEFYGLARRLLRQDDWGDKFSEKFIKDRLQSIVASVVQSDDKEDTASRLLKEFVDLLEGYNEEQIVLVPIAGLLVEPDAIRLGNVTLSNVTPQKAEEHLARVRSVILKSKHTEEEKKKLIEMLDQRLRRIIGTVWAEFRVIAEPDKARERAELETARVVDILRYAIPELYPGGHEVDVGLAGEISSTWRDILTVSSSYKSFRWFSEATGPLTRFEFNNDNRQKMEKSGTLELFDLLARPAGEISDFENVLLRAVHWFSNSLSQREIENAFLSLVICLETLLSPRGQDPIANSIAEGVAILLASKLEARKRLKSRVKRWYDLRSALSHKGKVDIPESDARKLRLVTKLLIVRLVQRKAEFQAQTDLLDWIEEEKLG